MGIILDINIKSIVAESNITSGNFRYYTLGISWFQNYSWHFKSETRRSRNKYMEWQLQIATTSNGWISMELFVQDFAPCKCYGSFCSWERWIRPSGHQKPWRRNAIVTLDAGLQKSLNSEIPNWRTWVTWKRFKSHQKSSNEEKQAYLCTCLTKHILCAKVSENLFFPPETLFYGVNCCNCVLLREEPPERKFSNFCPGKFWQFESANIF